MLAATISVATIFYEQAQSGAAAARHTDAARMHAALQGIVHTVATRAEGLAHSAARHWPRVEDEFAGLADALQQAPGLDRVALIRYLTAAQRSAYEAAHGPIFALPLSSTAPRAPSSRRVRSRPQNAAAQLPSPPPQAIAEGSAPPPLPAGPGGPPTRAPPSSHYFVSTCVVERSPSSLPAGMDVGLEPARRLTMLAAADSGHAMASPPLPPLTQPGARPATTVFYVPIYRPDAPTAEPRKRIAALRGFIAASFRYSTLTPTLESTVTPGASFALSEGTTRLLSKGRPEDAQLTAIGFAGRYWTLAVGTPPADLSLVIDTLLAGASMTVLMGLLSLQGWRRERAALVALEQRAVQSRMTESALATAEERFRTAFSEAPIGMALIALDGRLLQVNRALARIAGRSEPDLLTLTVAALTHPDDRRGDEMAMGFMRSGQMRVHTVQKRLMRGDGAIAWVSAHTTLIRDGSGQPAYFLSQLEDITDRRRYEARLQYLADHDPLTGLLNRRAFEHALKEHLADARASEDDTMDAATGAVLVLDVDAFKEVNDTLGHSAGDDLIMRVGNALRSRLRGDDVIARLGGDEFAILLRGGSSRQAQQVAEALLANIRRQRAPRERRGRERPVTASIGIAPLDGGLRATAEQALAAADLAMYDAKEAGGDRSETYGGGVGGGSEQRAAGDPASPAGGRRSRIETRLEWVEQIRAALDEDRLLLEAQPVVETDSGRITQHEMLLRMRRRDGKLIQPDSFLPVAERYGLIREIDRWVIGHAIALLAQQRELRRRPVVELNLSGQSISDEGLSEHVRTQLLGSGVEASQLIFEVTETAAIANIAAARRCAEELGTLGCRFALDDFGAGFGSFYYLKHLPFDFIKIDGEFVRSCTSNATDRLVIGAVVALARGMSKRTIAEFVGDRDTLRTLTELGVDYVQGFHLGRPASLEGWLSYAEGTGQRPDGAAPDDA